jgi:hypothetical protein
MCSEINLVLPLTSKETYPKLNNYISFDSSVTRNMFNFRRSFLNQLAYIKHLLLAAQKRHNGRVLNLFT